jgi:SAM-dependent methyltransferase
LIEAVAGASQFVDCDRVRVRNDVMAATCPVTATPICPLTGDPMTFWLHVPCDWRRPEAGAAYDLFWSREARFGQLHPRPSRAEVASFYEVDYYTHRPPGPAAAPPRKGFLERLREHLAWRVDFGSDITAERLAALPTGSSTVLEIGCGDGELLAAFRAIGWAGVGVEPDPAARAVAAHRGLEVYDGTGEELPPVIQDRDFDLVIFQHVLEHCLEPLRALRAVTTHLKPGGVLVIETPNTDAAGCRAAGPAWPWLDVPRHLNFFTDSSLRRACRAAGLTPVATEYTGYTRQFQRPWLEVERRIRSAFSPDTAPGLSRRAWRLLVQTAFSPARYKYDSLRIIARPGCHTHRMKPAGS